MRREPLAWMEDCLPEEFHYRDEGCDLAPSCLRCPFDACRYDLRGGRDPVREARNAQIRRLHRIHGLTSSELAQRFGISLRSVQRILKRRTIWKNEA